MSMMRHDSPAKPVSLAGVSSIVGIAQWRGSVQPDSIAYTYLLDGESEEQNLTYGELDRAARAVAAELQRLDARGKRALLLYEPGLDYITSLFGCLYAGVIAVPAYPPDLMRMDRMLPRLRAIIDDAQAALVLGTSESLQCVESLLNGKTSVETVWSTDDVDDEDASLWVPMDVAGDDLAFLQYTSGSTGSPKGVMIRHDNLLYNVEVIHSYGDVEGVVGVTWLPMYHDLGLVAGVLLPLYSGRRTVSMSPLAFIQRPYRWLKAISNYRGTTTGAPNFAYDLAVRKTRPGELTTLDLSCWKIALSGGEPVQADTLRRFSEAFGPAGFQPTSFAPCYGLAEATLAVSGCRRWDPPVVRSFAAVDLETGRAVPLDSEGPSARTVVGCGQPPDGTDVFIVNPETHECCPDNEVGEVWVRGPGVAAGYWNRPEETERTFDAYTADTADGPFLRTGDLGFFDRGELFVTGRVKDLIIICGRNHYPQDIERTVAGAHPSLRLDSGAAFSIDVDGEERVAIVQEFSWPKRFDPNEVIQRIRTEVLAEHDVSVHAVALIRPGTIKKTSSGKIQRRSCREAYLEERLSVVAHWRSGGNGCDGLGRVRQAANPPRTETERRLLSLWREVLGSEGLDISDNFFDLGGHSLLATQLVARIRSQFEIDLPLRDLFAAPTVAQLASKVDELYRTQPSTSRVGIARVHRAGDQPLSWAQKRLWFIHHLVSEEPISNLCVAAHIAGDLEAEAMERSLTEIGRRHDSLRTTFSSRGGEPVQRIGRLQQLPLEKVDLEGLTPALRDAELKRLSEAEARRPFDLEAGPLWRVMLVRLDEAEHVLVLSMHHIISDGWSMGVLLGELLLLYEAELAGRPSPLAELEVQYVDFVAWQQQWLQGDSLDKQLDYWRQWLGKDSVVLDLPTDRPRPARQSFRGATREVRLPRELSSSIERFSRREDVTPFMTLLAGFQTLLHRYTGQTEINVGTAVANRPRPELETLIGFFVNMLVMRGDVSGDPSFRELLSRTRETALDAYENQDVPFERLVAELAQRRDISHSPLFQVALVLQNVPFDAPGKRLTVSEVHNGTSKYDLTIVLWKDSGQFVGSIEYCTDLFEPETIDRLMSHFQTILAGAIAHPEEKISLLPIVPDSERQRLLIDWIPSRPDSADGGPIHELIEAQVDRAPEAVALILGGQQMSYRDLDERANRLARYLRGLGVGPETLVGVCVDRSLEIIESIVGILKAGGAYVPLDPNYPAERLAYMLDDCGAELLVTTAKLKERFLRCPEKVVCLDRDAGQIAQQSPRRLAVMVSPDNLAYVIYTSGSTGRPKGVAIQHRSLCHVSRVLSEQFGIDVGGRVLQFASASFDASVAEIFPTLISGAALCLANREELLPGPDLIDLLKRERISVATFPPSALAVLPETGLPELRTLVTAGESCRRELLRRWSPGRQFINGYGPTEATICATLAHLGLPECVPEGERTLPRQGTKPSRANGKHLAPRAADGPVPIGRPIVGSQVYVLDQQLQIVPIGVPGEVYVGGAGLARGYLNRPELTAERFVPHPFDDRPGARLYRTGDLARWLSDGNLEFLGRVDHQVKIRGFRVELGEIEEALREHPAVREAVVVASEDRQGKKRLVAYVVPGGDGKPTIDELRGHLKDWLPEMMVPAAFVTLGALPRTPNGKVDRGALPAPDGSRPASIREYVAPRTPREETLARLWKEVLGVEQVGVDDTFFELGGDSLLVMQVVARAGQEGLYITPRQFFEHPTVAGLAAVAGTTRRIFAEQGTLSGDAPLTPIQHWFLEQNLADSHHFNQAILLKVSVPLDPDVLQRAVAKLLEHHDALRAKFVRRDGLPRQTLATPGEPAPFGQVDLSGVPPAERSTALERAAAEWQASLNLEQGPLVRVVWFDFGKGEASRLLLVIHHMVVDVVSWRILLEDLGRLYQQLAAGQEPSLAPKTTSYRAWGQKLEEFARSDALRSELDYWIKEMDGPIAPLPIDQAEGENTQTSVRTVVVSLEADETTALLEDVPRVFRTQINEVLISALARTVSLWTGNGEVLIDLEGHGREDVFDDVDLSRTVGWFTTVFPLRLRLPEGGTPASVLGQVCAQVRRVPRRGLGYGVLRYLAPHEESRERLRTLPQPEISFNYLGQIDQQFASQGALAEAPESSGPCASGRQKRRHLVEVNASVRQGRLRAEWSYSDRIHRRETVESVAGQFVDTLRALLAAARSGDSRRQGLSEFAEPRNALEFELSQLFEEALGLNPVGIRDDFFSLGGGKPTAAGLVRTIRERFRVDYTEDDLSRGATVEETAERLRQSASHKRPSPLVPIQTGGSRPPLFCVHPASGVVYPYYNLSRHLGPDQPFFGLQAPGLDSLSPAREHVEQLAVDYLEAVRKVRPVGPYSLAGWSFGGFVAYEMARQIVAAGEEVAMLALFDSFVPAPDAQRDEEDMYAVMLQMFPLLRQVKLDEVRQLRRFQLVDDFIRQLESARMVPAGTGAVQAWQLLDVFEANCKATLGYRPGRYCGELDLYRVSDEEEGMPREPLLGWGHYADGPLTVHPMPGSHVTLLTEPHVQELARRLRERLDKVCVETGSAR